jgi:hypothetical protein
MDSGPRWWRNRERQTARTSDVWDVHNDLDRHDYELERVREVLGRIEEKQDTTNQRMVYILISTVMLLLAVIGNIVVIVSVANG